MIPVMTITGKDNPMYTIKINCNQVMRLTGHLRLCARLLMVSQVLGWWEHALGQRLRKEIPLQIQQKDGFLDIYCRFIGGYPIQGVFTDMHR